MATLFNALAVLPKPNAVLAVPLAWFCRPNAEAQRAAVDWEPNTDAPAPVA